MEMVYLGSDPKEWEHGAWKSKPERKVKPSQGYVVKVVTARGNLDLTLLETMWESHRMCPRIVCQDTEDGIIYLLATVPHWSSFP